MINRPKPDPDEFLFYLNALGPDTLLGRRLFSGRKLYKIVGFVYGEERQNDKGQIEKVNCTCIFLELQELGYNYITLHTVRSCKKKVDLNKFILVSE